LAPSGIPAISSALRGRILLKSMMSNTRTEITYENNLQLNTFQCILIRTMKGRVFNARGSTLSINKNYSLRCHVLTVSRTHQALCSII